MSTYAIGDIQGCFSSFNHLLQEINFSPSRDQLWLVGDIVNRGPDSLSMLRWAHQHQACVHMVLGNHELHTLAVAHGFARHHRQDTLETLLAAADRNVLLEWLRTRPLIYNEDRLLMVHAGLAPTWDAAQAVELAAEVEATLCGPHFLHFLAHMYGNTPACWSADLQGIPRLRTITNALTRIRVCDSAGTMELRYKGGFADIPQGFMPWFDVPTRKTRDHTVIFGHWSALGLLLRDRLIGLDSGCLWGHALSAVRLEDRQLFQIPCAPQDRVD